LSGAPPIRAEPLSGSDWLARTLAESGTTHVFFVDAILRRTLVELGSLGVACVLPHSEKAAAYMADGYARIAGRPGICMAQSVGAANLAAGIQDAYLGRSPVIAITGHKPPAYQHRNAYQEIEHAPLFAPVTKFAAPVMEAADLPRLLRLAWRATLVGTPRPAHLDLAGLQGEIVEAGEIGEPPVLGLEARRLPPYRPAADPAAVERAAALLKETDRVVIVAGEGATASLAGPELLMLAETLQAPVATTLGARGLIPTLHRLSIGVPGTYSAPPANRIVNAADVVLFVGCDTGDQATLNWTVPPLTNRVIQIDIDPLEFGRSYPDVLALSADPKTALVALLQAIGRPERDTSFADESGHLVAAWRGEIATLLSSDATPIRVERLCAEITRVLPSNGILVADTGYAAIWTGNLVELNGAGQTYLRAAGSLGWSFPAALGAKCAAPDRPVVCFTGDGGFYYHLGELETARRRGIPVVVVVNNNAGFGMSLDRVRQMLGTRSGPVADLVSFGPTDFAAVARSFGVRGIRVTQPGDIGPALEDALAAHETVVVDVVTDIDPCAPEPWTPGSAP
jgi:acetolactate synthase-1/2/3 large subunit